MKYLKMIFDAIKTLISLFHEVNTYNDNKKKDIEERQQIKEKYKNQLEKDESAVVNGDADHIQDIFK